MQHKYLIVKGIAGLGNRLATLANAIGYAQQAGRILFVDWSDGIFGAKGNNVFYRYFRLNQIPYIESLDEIPVFDRQDCYPPAWGERPGYGLYDLYARAGGCLAKRLIPNRILKGSFSKIHNYWHPKNDAVCVRNDRQAFKAVFNKNDIPFGGNYRKAIRQPVLFYADFCPRFSNAILRKNIALTEDMREETERAATRLGTGGNVVGVHVRMTDLQPEKSLEYLSGKISGLKLRRPAIFLATDSEQAEEYFARRHENVIFAPKQRLKYDAQTGVHLRAVRTGDYSLAESTLKESITDMWLLSKCEYLICQKNSSFSRISAILKNQPENTFAW